MRHPAKREQSGAAIARALRPLSDELDRVLAALDAGVLTASQYDDLEHRAQSIGTGIRAAFRKGGA